MPTITCSDLVDPVLLGHALGHQISCSELPCVAVTPHHACDCPTNDRQRADEQGKSTHAWNDRTKDAQGECYEAPHEPSVELLADIFQLFGIVLPQILLASHSLLAAHNAVPALFVRAVKREHEKVVVDDEHGA